MLVTYAFRKEDQDIGGTNVPPASKSNHLVGHTIDMNLDTPRSAAQILYQFDHMMVHIMIWYLVYNLKSIDKEVDVIALVWQPNETHMPTASMMLFKLMGPDYIFGGFRPQSLPKTA